MDRCGALVCCPGLGIGVFLIETVPILRCVWFASSGRVHFTQHRHRRAGCDEQVTADGVAYKKQRSCINLDLDRKG